METFGSGGCAGGAVEESVPGVIPNPGIWLELVAGPIHRARLVLGKRALPKSQVQLVPPVFLAVRDGRGFS